MTDPPNNQNPRREDESAANCPSDNLPRQASDAPQFSLYGDEDRDETMLYLKSSFARPSLMGLLFLKLRKAERQYQRKRASAPYEHNPRLARRWFWRIMLVGTILPIISLIGFVSWHYEAAPSEGAFNTFISVMLGVSFLSLFPFFFYAIHSRGRLLRDHTQVRPTKGGLVGLSIVYALFYLFLVPWVISISSHDPTGMVEVLVVYFLVIVPVLALIGLAVGRKMAPARRAVWVSGMLNGSADKPETTLPTTKGAVD